MNTARVKLEKIKDLTFTYVGAGLEAPRYIKFMDKIDCYIDEPFTVDGTKGELIYKLRGNKSFIEGNQTDEGKKKRIVDEKKEREKNNKIQQELSELNEQTKMRNRK